MNVRWLLAIAILGFSFVAALWGGMAARKANQPPAMEVVDGLAIAPADLDLGEVWEEKGVAWRLPIRNLTAGQIEIREFRSSCGCTAIEPRSLSIPPGETATVQLTLDLTHRSFAESGLARRPFALTLRPILPNARPRGSGWQLHGTIKSRVTLDTPTVHFGEQPIHGEAPVTRKVVATVHVPCQRLEVTANPLVASASVQRREDDETRFDIALTANPALKPGHFNTDAQISVVGPSGKRALAFTLPIAGEMRPEVRLLPARVLMGAKPVGETAEAVVTLQAPPEAKVAVDHIEIDDAGLRVEPAAIEGIPAGRAYRLRQQVAKNGEQTSTVRFVIRKPGQKLLTLPVEVCYRGELGKKVVANAPEGKQP